MALRDQVYGYFMPTVNLMGVGCSKQTGEQVKVLGGTKALIVTDDFLAKSGMAGDIKAQVEAAGAEAVIYAGAEPNPTDINVHDGLKVYQDNKCDIIISLGGGSSHDCAKGIGILVNNGGNIRDYEGIDQSTKPMPPFIAINTTAGTASEMTRFCIITDTDRKVKMAIVDWRVTPNVAINDPLLMVGMPPSLTAATGMDALTHAVEAYVSTAATPVTDAAALQAIELISKNLRNVVANGQNLEARDKMAYAEYLAGMAFNNASLGYVHAMAHQLGGMYNLPHGVCNAILLPHVCEFNLIACVERFADIAAVMGENIAGLSSRAAASAAIEAIKQLSEDVGIPSGLRELGVREKDLHTMAENAMKDACSFTNPRTATLEDVMDIYRKAMENDGEAAVFSSTPSQKHEGKNNLTENKNKCTDVNKSQKAKGVSEVPKILRINMTSKELKWEDVPEKYLPLGGRALTSQMILDEVPATCEALGGFNKLVIAPGLLSGTNAPSSGRLSVGGKSPLTGGIKEANAGGITSQKLANLGIKAMVLEGLPAGNDWYMIKINPEGAELIPANDLAGKGTYETTAICRQKYGEKVAVITIGPAGEMLMASAGVANNDSDGNSSRYAGRGGLGAVMGSKKIKAIVVDCPKTFDAPVKDPEKFKAAAKKFSKMLLDHPVCGQGLPSYGTNVLMNIINEAGALPTRNFSKGRFDGANDVSGEKLAEVAKERGGKATHACHPGCIMRCSNVYPMPDGKVCAPIEYETAWCFGPNLEINDLDVVAKLNYICNDVGLDTIEAGCTLGVLAEAGVIPFGDGQAAIKALEEVEKGTSLGRIIGSGATVAGKAFGVTRIPAVKGQGIPAYDPRSCKGNGVTYATTPMGADHTAGYAVTANILKVGGHVDPTKSEGQVELSRNLQVATAAVDATGLCLFVAFAVLDNPEGVPTIVEMINAQYGTQLTPDDVVALGQQILKVEREFNKKAGFTKADDRLPEFFTTEEFEPHNTKFDIKDEELDEVFNF